MLHVWNINLHLPQEWPKCRQQSMHGNREFSQFFSFFSRFFQFIVSTFIPVWWLGTCFIFPYIGKCYIPTDVHIFQRGRYTNQLFPYPRLSRQTNREDSRRPGEASAFAQPATASQYLGRWIQDGSTGGSSTPRKTKVDGGCIPKKNNLKNPG